jgi:hypothetical protein
MGRDRRSYPSHLSSGRTLDRVGERSRSPPLCFIINKILEAGLVVYIRHCLCRSFPHVDKYAIPLKRTISGGFVGHACNGHQRTLHKPNYVSDCHSIRLISKKISAFRSAFRLNKAHTPKLIQNNLKEPRGDGLRLCDVADFHRALAVSPGEFEYSPNSVLTLLRHHLAAPFRLDRFA